jgi:hypothetical protein
MATITNNNSGKFTGPCSNDTLKLVIGVNRLGPYLQAKMGFDAGQKDGRGSAWHPLYDSCQVQQLRRGHLVDEERGWLRSAIFARRSAKAWAAKPIGALIPDDWQSRPIAGPSPCNHPACGAPGGAWR